MPVVSLNLGSQKVELAIPPGKLVQGRRERVPSQLGDLRLAVAASLETPIVFPALRQALTPDDHLAILVHEEINGLSIVMEAVLQHIHSAGVPMNQITVLAPPRLLGAETHWLSQLPEAYRGFQLEEHDVETSKTAYLASTKGGRRIYLNRHIVDADQLIIVGNVRFDPVYGIACGLADLFPTFSDSATKQELTRHLHEAVPAVNHPFPIWKETETVGWELGMPFVVCVLEGTGESVCQVMSGSSGPVREQAEAWLRATHIIHLPYQVDLVIGTLSGSPREQSFHRVCQAAFRASRIAHQGGNVALLSEAGAVLPPGAEIMSQAETVVEGLTFFREHPHIDRTPWWYLASALEQTRVYLASHFQQEVVESLFMVPFDQPGQVQNLIDQAKSIVIVEAANRTHLEITKQVH